MTVKRCKWVEGESENYIKYHDNEWGVPTYNDNKLFEMLVLESFQSGLSWKTILNKRENFKKAFNNFNIEKIIEYDEHKISKLAEDKSIIRHKAKIQATVNNAKIFKEIQKEYGSFKNYIWGFTDGEIIKSDYQTKSELSDNISKDLKKRGMKYLGSTTVYAYLEAIGIINNHTPNCFKFEL